MEEQNQPLPCPIVDESTAVQNLREVISEAAYINGMSIEEFLENAMGVWLADAIRPFCVDLTPELTDDDDEDTMFKRPLVESDFTVTGNSEGDEWEEV